MCENDNFLELLAPDIFVAIHISNYTKVPVVGKVLEVNENDFKIHYWQGSYSKPWKQHVLMHKKKSVPWTAVLPQQSIILCGFQLDENFKLPECSRKHLKRWYHEHRK